MRRTRKCKKVESGNIVDKALTGIKLFCGVIRKTLLGKQKKKNESYTHRNPTKRCFCASPAVSCTQQFVSVPQSSTKEMSPTPFFKTQWCVDQGCEYKRGTCLSLPPQSKSAPGRKASCACPELRRALQQHGSRHIWALRRGRWGRAALFGPSLDEQHAEMPIHSGGGGSCISHRVVSLSRL